MLKALKIKGFRVSLLGSNPSLRAKNMGMTVVIPIFFLFMGIERDSRVGAVLREQNALPYGDWITVKLTAKDDVDNVGAGRAAKGANSSACATALEFCENA